jgi:hypothetical protein
MMDSTKDITALQFPGLDTGGRKYLSPHLRAGLTVYPLDDRGRPFAKDRSTIARRIDWDPKPDASIIQFNWNKQMGQPSGQWSAIVKELPKAGDAPRLDFRDQDIADGDWCDVAILRNGFPIPLCRGVVDSVRTRSTTARGATVRNHYVSGRDHGAFFEKPITWSSLWARTLNEIVSGLFTQRVGGKVGGRPDELFRSLIEATFKGSTKQGVPSGQWVLPPSLKEISGGGKRLFDLLEIVTFNASKRGGEGLRGAYYNEPGLWTVGEQPLHQTLSQWVNPLLNEWWYDLLPPERYLPKNGLFGFLGSRDVVVDDNVVGEEGPIQPLTAPEPVVAVSENDQFGTIAAIIRERPFPTTVEGGSSMWFDLPTWVIPTWLCDDIDLGRSGNQRFNLFELLGDFGLGPQQEQAAFSKPRWWKEDITRHGLCTYSQSTRFFDQGANGPGGWFEERSKWLQIVADWHGPNPNLLQGMISVKVPLPEIRIGHRVILTDGNPENDIQLYVEGVGHTLQAPTVEAGVKGSSKFTVTRGFQGTDQQLLVELYRMSLLYQEVF